MSRSRLWVATFFTSSGVAHITVGRRFFERIVPPWLPFGPKLINEAAGYAEIAGGGLALVPGAQKAARTYLTALLLAVFPANLHMAVKPEDSGSEKIPRWLLLARLPLQFVMIAWVHRALPDRSAAPAAVSSAE